MWTRDIQNTVRVSRRPTGQQRFNDSKCFATLLCVWLGGLPSKEAQGQAGRLLTIEEVGHTLNGSLIHTSASSNHANFYDRSTCES